MNIQLDAAICSDIGIKRKQNQDCAGMDETRGLFVLADGMGGHQGGEIASQLCVEQVQNYFSNLSETIPISEQIHQSLIQANHAIFQRAQNEPHLKGMGTTATVLKINSDGSAHIGQVGDSRAYFWNSKGIWQLTLDHSLVQEKLRAGLITRDQVKTDEMKNVITRSVGYEPLLKVDTFTLRIQSGDGFLLCSDGLSNPLSDPLLFDILDESMKSGLSLIETSKRLVQAANERGGDDNVTVVLVRIK